MAARSRGTEVRFEPDEITVHFDDPDASSRQVLDAAKRLGLELDLTPRQLDRLRRRTDELRAWLKNRAERHEAFVRDPAAVLDALAGKDSPSPSSRGGPQVLPRWAGVGRAADVAAAETELREWVLAEPGRLARFLKNPASVIDAALPGHSPAFRKRVAARDDAAPSAAEDEEP